MTTSDALCLHSGPQSPRLLLAHGAGAPMDSAFMEAMAARLAERGVGVVRFEFPYMQQRRQTGSKRPPDRQPVLLDCWRQMIATWSAEGPLFIGGKSMGGRMATLVAAEAGELSTAMAGVVCLGYPFHPPGKPDKTRTDHLADLSTPTLIVQGTRDALGRREEVESYELSDTIQLHWLEDGDHDLKPRVRSGLTHEQHLDAAAEAVAGFIFALAAKTNDG